MAKSLIVLLALTLIFSLSDSCAKEANPQLILLITEQNIEGPQRAWWASEIDLSTVEATLAKKISERGFEIIQPTNLTKIIEKDKAFRRLVISEQESIQLGNLSQADYVVLGKAVASSGSKVPLSNLISCFANISVKLIRVSDGKVIEYADASGRSAHLDVITGGKEALSKAAEDLATKIIEALSKEGGK